MNLSPDELMARLREPIVQAFTEVGGEIVGTIKEAISVPVEYGRGPRGGTIVIRSKPGEPPRMETGDLRADVQMEVSSEPGEPVKLTVFDTEEYAGYLEFGTSKMLPRPIWRTTALDYAPVVAGAVISKLRES